LNRRSGDQETVFFKQEIRRPGDTFLNRRSGGQETGFFLHQKITRSGGCFLEQRSGGWPVRSSTVPAKDAFNLVPKNGKTVLLTSCFEKKEPPNLLTSCLKRRDLLTS
jgi:hypothetical protein